jgi:excisionase family DNA binding protein
VGTDEHKRDNMDPFEKLEHQTRAWSVAETAKFLGYSRKTIYRLIRQGKIEGWMQNGNGKIVFCPCKLKKWMEKRFKGNDGLSTPDSDSSLPPRKEDTDNEAA